MKRNTTRYVVQIFSSRQDAWFDERDSAYEREASARGCIEAIRVNSPKYFATQLYRVVDTVTKRVTYESRLPSVFATKQPRRVFNALIARPDFQDVVIREDGVITFSYAGQHTTSPPVLLLLAQLEHDAFLDYNYERVTILMN